MEFTKRSNLGALLAAVLVGLLSLCINQVFRVQPEDLDRFLASVSQLRKDMQQRRRPAEREPQRLQDDLVQLEKALNKIYRNQVQGETPDTAQLMRFVNTLTATATALENHEQATFEQIQQGRMLAFSGLFLAAQLMPDEFTEQFREKSEVILSSDATSSQKEHVRLLSEFHKFKLGRLQDAVVLRMLKDSAEQQADESLAIQLYLLVAEEIWNQGRVHLARDILQQGVNAYQNHPNKQKLANRLIDLQIDTSTHRIN